MPNLTDLQTTILKHAAGFVDGAILPLPEDVKMTGGALNSMLGALRKKGLADRGDDDVWRIAAAGRAVVAATPAAEPASPEGEKPSARAGSKQALLVELLQRPEGATIADIQAETDWQAHSVRGAISGVCKKKLGLAVASAVEGERGRVYRIVADA